jgi:hypothetical protein
MRPVLAPKVAVGQDEAVAEEAKMVAEQDTVVADVDRVEAEVDTMVAVVDEGVVDDLFQNIGSKVGVGKNITT